MKKFLLLFFLLSFSISIFSQQLKTSSAYSFTENKGQIVDQDGKQNPAVQYLFNSGGLNVQIKNDGFSYDVYEVKKVPKKKSKRRESDLPQKNKLKTEYDLKYEYHRVDIDFVGANKNPEIIAEGKSVDYDNYYNIPNRPKGVENVHRYEKITYQNLYSNIDLVFFQPKDTLKPIEYNFIVNPGGKISDIQLKFNGAKTQLKDGKLSMNLRFGEMQENIPHSWEEEGNLKKSINVGFKDLGNGVYGFNADRDVSDKVVVIDPVPTRIWYTDHFNITHQYGTKIKVISDKNNKIYTLDSRLAKYIVTTGEYTQNGTGSQNYGYLACFNENGNKLWGLYIGNHHNSQDESNQFNDFELDSENNLIVVGSARDNSAGNNNISTTGAYQENSVPSSYSSYDISNNDAFIMKFNSFGQKLWGTYYGGNNFDQFQTVEVDSEDNLILLGRTLSPNFIVSHIQNIINSKNEGFFISKFSKNGQLLNSFLLPINSSYNGRFLTSLDKNDNLYLASSLGKTFTGNVEGTLNTHQTKIIGASNVFLVKIDKNFNYKWGTYFGGRNKSGLFYNNDAGETEVEEIKCDEDGNVIIAGGTNALEKIATPGTHMLNNSNDWHDMYIAKFTPQGKQIWGTYYGDANPPTTGDDNLLCMHVDENNIFVGGWTSSKNNITTPDGYISYYDFYNQGFFAKFNSSGKQVWGSYYKRPVWSIFAKNNFVYTFTNYEVSKFYDCKNAINYSSNSPVCVNYSIDLQASGGTNYSWTGPNGFSSTQQNPTIPNATILNSGIYSCTISGTSGCDGTFNVEVKVEDKTAPIPDIANLLTITGNCKTVISTIPTATDNCAGNIVGTTTDPLQYSLPGNYIIHWKYDDGNGNISTQNQNVTIVSEPVPTGNAAQNFCLINNPKISNIQISGTSIKWYNAAGNLLNANTLLVDGTQYYATQTLNGCESAKTEITIAVNDPIAPTGNASQTFCSAQLPKISDILVTGQNIKWFDASGNILPTTALLLDGKTYFATQTVNGCESTQKLSVTAIVKNGGIPANDYAMAICNPTTSNTKIENLINYKGNLIANPGIYIFEFFNAANQVIADPSNVILNLGANIFNVKISNNLGCFDFVKLTLTLDPKPPLNLPEKVEFCNGQSVPLDAGGNGIIAYEWTRTDDPKVISNQQILVVSTPGDYILKVENTFGCQNSTIIKVTKSVLAHITGVQIVNNTATVQMSAVGDFIYSLDQVNWQNSNVFQNLANGNYTVYVQTKLGCIIGSMNFSIFNVTNIFTPNADGMNDTWEISGLENYPNSEVKVFDRFGNTVLQKITNGTFEWDGTFNSRKLPTGNYWYVIKVSDGRLLNGWLLLKNRN